MAVYTEVYIAVYCRRIFSNSKVQFAAEVKCGLGRCVSEVGWLSVACAVDEERVHEMAVKGGVPR